MEPRSVFDGVCYLRARLFAAFCVDSCERLDVKTNEIFLVEHGVCTSAYMVSFVDYLVAIPESAEDMKFRQFGFAFLIPTVCCLVS